MTRLKLLIATAAALGFAPSAFAAPVPGSPDPAAVQPGAYTVEPTHTRILFSLSHMGFSTWYGDMTGASGTLSVDPRRPSGDRLSISVPVASVSTTNAKLDGELKAPDWLDAAKYPAITFVSTRVTRTSAGHADVTGDFTLHGVTRPLTLHVKFNGSGINPLSKAYTVGFDATGTIKRSEFGVAKNVPVVGDDVDLMLSGAFVKAPA